MPLLRSEATNTALRLSWSIGASADAVWTCLTNPPHLRLWLGDLAEGSVAEGETFAIDHGDGYQCCSAVELYDAPRALTYSWTFPDEHRTLVAWTLTPRSSDTVLDLNHTGLDELVRSYFSGWMTHLTFLEGAAVDAPIPSTMFWPLHDTFARLNG